MTSTNHALTGAFLVASIKNPAIALPLAFLSHFVLDMVPHWNHKVAKKRNKLVNTIEFFVTLSLALTLVVMLEAPTWLLVAGMLLAVVPDLMWLPEIWYGKLPAMDGGSILHRVRRLHQRIQWSETPKGIFVEGACFTLMLGVLIAIK